MRKTVKVGGLLVPLIMSVLFLIAGLVLPFGGSAERAVPSLLLSLALFLSSSVVGIHLLWPSSATSIAGIVACGIVLAVVTYLFAKSHFLGSSGYWQVAGAVLLSAIACALHLQENRSAQANLF